ncbi:hypothetical protein [Allosediminivita pacifica]|uniref:Uncharacterized protein n=1 Tax=Allosediminivita pacifica TaxID=1267769 RepID=A0A2T6AX50_9RHOB|nr:hypothetical protein [Allosediminivita pacifica]PTX48404.1 hypothetical protein C8N44_10995 [Allosediminivita pacifica]
MTHPEIFLVLVPAALLASLGTGSLDHHADLWPAELALIGHALVAVPLALTVASAAGTFRPARRGEDQALPLFAARPVLHRLVILRVLSRCRRAAKTLSVSGLRPIMSLCQWLSEGRGWLRPVEAGSLVLSVVGIVLLLWQAGILVPGGRLP